MKFCGIFMYFLSAWDEKQQVIVMQKLWLQITPSVIFYYMINILKSTLYSWIFLTRTSVCQCNMKIWLNISMHFVSIFVLNHIMYVHAVRMCSYAQKFYNIEMYVTIFIKQCQLKKWQWLAYYSARDVPLHNKH